MRRLVGNEQLVAIMEKAGESEGPIHKWASLLDLAQARTPLRDLVENLAPVQQYTFSGGSA